MSVSLSKGQGVSLKKNEYDLSSVTIGLGWDINELELSNQVQRFFEVNFIRCFPT